MKIKYCCSPDVPHLRRLWRNNHEHTYVSRYESLNTPLILGFGVWRGRKRRANTYKTKLDLTLILDWLGGPQVLVSALFVLAHPRQIKLAHDCVRVYPSSVDRLRPGKHIHSVPLQRTTDQRACHSPCSEHLKRRVVLLEMDAGWGHGQRCIFDVFRVLLFSFKHFLHE